MSFTDGYKTTGVECHKCGRGIAVIMNDKLPDPFGVTCPHCQLRQTRRVAEIQTLEVARSD